MKRSLAGWMGWRLAALMAVSALCGMAPAAADDEPTMSEKVTNTYKEHVVVERTTTTREIKQVVRKQKEKYACAIFVANRAKKVEDQKVLAMQDLLTGYATDKGFRVIAREDVINAVRDYAKEGPNRGTGAEPNADQLLSDNTSAMRLAQMMNADYVLVVTITSFGTDKQAWKDPRTGRSLVGITHQMRTTYRVLDTTLGGSTTAGVATVRITDRIDPEQNAIERENLVDDLIDGAALDMAAMMSQAARNDAIAANDPAAKREVSFEVYCGVADMVFPEVVKDEAGEYIVTAGRYRLEALGFTVELDGVVIGTTGRPNGPKLSARPGLHKMRLSRALFKDWVGTVNIREGTVLQIAMEMSADGLREFAEMTKFMEQLKQLAMDRDDKRRLTEAQAKMWEGYAKQMEQSGVRIDRQNRREPGGTDVKVDVNVNNRRVLPDDEPRPDQKKDQ